MTFIHEYSEFWVNLPNRIARVIFMVDGNLMVLLHGFVKKTLEKAAWVLGRRLAVVLA